MEKYLIFSKNIPFRPISLIDRYGNSCLMELSKNDALACVEAENKKYGSDIFYCMTIEEWKKQLESPQMEKVYEEMDKICGEIKEIIECKKFVDTICKEIDKNINGFMEPFKADNNKDYEIKLKEKLDAFVKEIDRPAFRKEENLVDDVKCICKKVIDAFEAAMNDNRKLAGEIICEIIEEYKKDPFAVTELDKSYAFRGVAPFDALRPSDENELYKQMLEGDLSFYRARPVNKAKFLSEIDEINYLSHSKKSLAKDLRFSSKDKVCLYLGTTSYVCAKESRWNGDDNLYLSSFRFNENGKKLKILNLVILQSFLNGMISESENKKYCKELYYTMIRVFPLVLATMCTIKTDDETREKTYGENFKAEYLLSQIIIEQLNKTGVDGIAYLSRQGKNDLQYPQMVCLAIPILDANAENEYGNLINCYDMTRPILFNGIKIDNTYKKRSYINSNYPKYLDGSLSKIENYTAKIDYEGKEVFYEDTIYSKVDDYLVNLEHMKVCEKKNDDHYIHG